MEGRALPAEAVLTELLDALMTYRSEAVYDAVECVRLSEPYSLVSWGCKGKGGWSQAVETTMKYLYHDHEIS